jgi:hypothetical protein
MQSIWVRKCARFLYAVCTIVCSTFGTHEFSPIKKISTEFTVEESGQKFADLELLCFTGETIFFAVFSVRESVGSGFATMRAPNASQCEPKKDRFERYRLARGKRSKSTQC